MKDGIIEKIKWAFIFWLARRLPDCKTITPMLSESLDRKLSIREKLVVKLHLFTCDPCARYLKQIRFLKAIFHANEMRTSEARRPELSHDARARMRSAIEAELSR